MKPLYQPRTNKVVMRGLLMPRGQSDEPVYNLDTLFQKANLLRHYYGMESCDIYSDPRMTDEMMIALTRYTSDIGLTPSIVEHSFPRAKCSEIEAAGLDHWIVSLHGESAAFHDVILGDAGSFERIWKGLDSVQRSVLFNTALNKSTYQRLPWTRLLERPPTVWNIIGFNPLYDWEDKMGSQDVKEQVTYREMAPYIKNAIEMVEKGGWEVNVRYFPLCIAEEFGFAENTAGYLQGIYDPWEWRLNASFKISMQQVEGESGWEQAEQTRAVLLLTERKNEVCAKCRYRLICDRPVKEYQAAFGLEEFKPLEGELIHDSLHFQKKRGYGA